MAGSRSPRPSVLPSFRPSAKLVPPTTPSADFCTAVRPPYGDLSLVAETQHRSPEVRSAAFIARPSDLPPRSLIVVDFAIGCSLVRSGRPLYPLLVHRAAILLHASFRPRLAATPLRFANPSPLSGWIEDFHLQAADHARHTANGSRECAPDDKLRDTHQLHLMEVMGFAGSTHPCASLEFDACVSPRRPRETGIAVICPTGQILSFCAAMPNDVV